MKFTLYWSNLDLYEKCPRQFLWERGWGAIDVGGGPGKGKPHPLKKSKHHAVMGIVIQAVIERLYNDELWKQPDGLADRLLKMVDREWSYQTAKSNNWIDYRVAGTKDSMLKVCRDGVTGYLHTMKANKLLGEWAKAEFELLGWVDKYNPIGGRADLIFQRKDTGVTLLDGKNSGTKGKYTNPDQLRWYALLFYLAYRKMPDRLGFVYYRFPYGAPILNKKGEPTGELESGVDWVPFTKDDLKGLAQRAVQARTGMNREKFDPVPEPKNCRFCEFETICEARQVVLERNRRGGKSVEGLKGSGAVVDFEL